jgi:hypothetical protein
VQTASHLEADVGVKLGPVLVNACYPKLALPPEGEAASQLAGAAAGPGLVADLLAAATYRRRREALQTGQIDRLAQLLPLPQLTTSFRFAPSLGPLDLAALAGELRLGIEALA